MSVMICGGPEPRTRAACYGGCYGWCYMADRCAIPESKLTERQRSEIRTFQKRSGGIFPNDLRTVEDFGLSPAMALMASSRSFETASPRNRTANALEARGLIGWWADDLDDMYNKSIPGHWHLMGEGADFVEKVTGFQPLLCRCVGRKR